MLSLTNAQRIRLANPLIIGNHHKYRLITISTKGTLKVISIRICILA